MGAGRTQYPRHWRRTVLPVLGLAAVGFASTAALAPDNGVMARVRLPEFTRHPLPPSALPPPRGLAVSGLDAGDLGGGRALRLEKPLLSEDGRALGSARMLIDAQSRMRVSARDLGRALAKAGQSMPPLASGDAMIDLAAARAYGARLRFDPASDALVLTIAPRR